MSSKKRNDIFRDRPGLHACRKTLSNPPVGRRSLAETGRRNAVLHEMRDAIAAEGTVFLRKPVRVTVDYCGFDYGFIVRKFGPAPGVLPDSLLFSLGKDEYGGDVSTEDVSTEDLEAVMAASHLLS